MFIIIVSNLNQAIQCKLKKYIFENSKNTGRKQFSCFQLKFDCLRVSNKFLFKQKLW